MAEPGDAKGGDDDERRTGRDRRRPPLTIDLTATPAGKAQGPAAAPRKTPPPPPPQASAAGSATPPRQPPPPPQPRPAWRWPNFARFAPQNMDRETWIGVGSAAALGGVIALILLMLLQGVGM